MEDKSSDLVQSDIKRSPPYSSEEPMDRKRRRVVDPDEAANEFLEDDFLGILDDPDDGSDGDPPIQGLDSVIRSFEEEIVVPLQDTSPVVSDGTPGGASDELGYLLEASDDELGLPPSFVNSADESSSHEVSELPDISSSKAFETPFDGEMPNYDNFDLGPEIHTDMGNEEFLMLGGLFDLADVWDVPEVMWRPESLPAV
ncbi:hypothetical protein MLD38_012480 [Melastoma candidum]|uniref:Uncharacterized protein n=1 Tax=Melastoma candidum TaxID=119954 RepID=A0ACB9RAM4_9MYRT|nr:hypothetical protein MLD38_012480 [Melastoma candidum]